MSTSGSQTKRISMLVSRYLLGAIVPYFSFAWLLLTVILFVQQAGRHADMFFNADIPGTLVWRLGIALLPSVIAFTCPMAVLVGTIIGLTRMQGDSELVAIRASGVGNWQIAVPIAVLGVLLSGFAFLVNLYGVPMAAGIFRSVALETALKKLESPVEPGEFNNDVAGYTIYVKSGDVDTGRWHDIFIYSEDRANNAVRLTTSRTGRVDSTDDSSELVLENASVTTLPLTPGRGKYVSENIGDVRIAIKTNRGDLIRKLSSSQLTPEELGLAELGDYAAAPERTARERIEAQLLRERRLLLSITPLIFCLLGTAIVLRLNRGGRGFGIALALVVLVIYYLLAFLGEQLARTLYIPVLVAALLPLAGSVAAFIWFSVSSRMSWLSRLSQAFTDIGTRYRERPHRLRVRDIFVDVTTGLRDFDIIRNLVQNFVLALVFVVVIFVIFTAFEMWKFAGLVENGLWLLAKYLFYLLPVLYLQISPSAAMIAILATYVVKSRQNEIVTWTSAGQSVYRLLLPCFLLMMALGGINWVLQENVLPRANQLQDATRAMIRSVMLSAPQMGLRWLAEGDRLYSYRIASDNEIRGAAVAQNGGLANAITSASDNEVLSTACKNCLIDLSVYQFSGEGKLRSVYRVDQAQWRDGLITFSGPVERDDIVDGRVVAATQQGGEVVLDADPLRTPRESPTHLDTSTLKKQLLGATSDSEKRASAVAVEERHTTPFLPLVIALFTAPFALSLSRKGKAATVGYAVALWLLFTGAAGVFEQLGLNGELTPTLAIWTPLAIFSCLGVFLLTKVRT
ncbi:MAG: LptF/LptG family permease [Pyrinomonadaceae bacterium]